jgi:hypothetical protein
MTVEPIQQDAAVWHGSRSSVTRGCGRCGLRLDDVLQLRRGTGGDGAAEDEFTPGERHRCPVKWEADSVPQTPPATIPMV